MSTSDIMVLTIQKKKAAKKKGQQIVSAQAAVEAEQEEQETKEKGKGRVFSANLLGFIRADHLWEYGGNGDDPNNEIRPVMAWFHGSPVALQTFVMNLRLGHPAVYQTKHYSSKAVKFEWLKKGGQILTAQQIDATNKVTQMYVPNLCNIHDGLVAADSPVATLVVTPSWWIDQHLPKLAATDLADIHTAIRLFDANAGRTQLNIPIEQHHRLAMVALRVMAYLDKRISKPLVTSIGYRYYLFLEGCRNNLWKLAAHYDVDSNAAKRDPLAELRYAKNRYHGLTFDAHGLWAVGIEQAVGIKAAHTAINETLARTTTLWMQAKGELAQSY